MSWAGPHREEGAERLLDGAASRWSQPQLGVGGCNQRFLKSYRDEQHRHCHLRPGRDSCGQRVELRKE